MAVSSGTFEKRHSSAVRLDLLHLRAQALHCDLKVAEVSQQA